MGQEFFRLTTVFLLYLRGHESASIAGRACAHMGMCIGLEASPPRGGEPW